MMLNCSRGLKNAAEQKQDTRYTFNAMYNRNRFCLLEPPSSAAAAKAQEVVYEWVNRFARAHHQSAINSITIWV